MVDELLGEVVEAAVKVGGEAVVGAVGEVVVDAAGSRKGWRGWLAGAVAILVLVGLVIWVFG